MHLAHVPLINSTQPLGETLPPLKEGNLGLRLLLLPSEQAESYLGRSQALAEARIDFCLNCQNDDIPLKIDPFLCHHPETFYFLIQPDSVPTVWQPPTTDSTQLTTGLIIAPADELAAIMGQAIGLDPDHYWRIAPVPGTLSVLHYPSTDHPPILQALNWA
ncbi:MAG: hypothetical protein HC881_03770 [Leptolyngbyaceae cyanobacterium SL_7_1]|nr:hypothetical protein [Leptolyngbyaceae cyanobacterium SL_7_1]